MCVALLSNAYALFTRLPLYCCRSVESSRGCVISIGMRKSRECWSSTWDRRGDLGRREKLCARARAFFRKSRAQGRFVADCREIQIPLSKFIFRNTLSSFLYLHVLMQSNLKFTALVNSEILDNPEVPALYHVEAENGENLHNK